jgi:hypothetical protein
MGKKSRRDRKTKEVKLYTREEKLEKITEIKGQIGKLGLDRFFVEEMDKLYKCMEEYVEKDIETYYETELPEAKRRMVVKLHNNKKHEISVALLYTGDDK